MSLIELRRGDDAIRDVTVTLAGEPVSLTSAQQVTFTAKRQHIDPDADAVIRKDLDDGVEIDGTTTNVAHITFVPEDTVDLECPAVFVWDVEIIDSDGLTKTVADGWIRLIPDVTLSASLGS